MASAAAPKHYKVAAAAHTARYSSASCGGPAAAPGRRAAAVPRAPWRRDSARAIKLLRGGASPHAALAGAATALHAAALGGAVGAARALVRAGAPVDAQLAAPLHLSERSCGRHAEAPAGSPPLVLAAALGHAAAADALLAVGASLALPTLGREGCYPRKHFADGGAAPWQWTVLQPHEARRAGERAAGAAAVRATLLEHVLACLQGAAAAPSPQPARLVQGTAAAHCRLSARRWRLAVAAAGGALRAAPAAAAGGALVCLHQAGRSSGYRKAGVLLYVQRAVWQSGGGCQGSRDDSSWAHALAGGSGRSGGG